MVDPAQQAVSWLRVGVLPLALVPARTVDPTDFRFTVPHREPDRSAGSDRMILQHRTALGGAFR
jgi:hypothetical protein